MLQIGRQLSDLGSTETRRVVTEIETQCFAQLDAQRQWIVSALMVVQVSERQPGRCTLLQRFGDGEVFEHQQTVEQRRALLPRPTLNVVERHVFKLAHGQVQTLQLAQPLADGLIRLHRAHQRQRVDEQPQLLFDPLQRC
ncbi:hypothetical protein D3C87_1009310 [compost metagenome]